MISKQKESQNAHIKQKYACRSQHKPKQEWHSNRRPRSEDSRISATLTEQKISKGKQSKGAYRLLQQKGGRKKTIFVT